MNTEELEEYIITEELNQLIDFSENADWQEGAFDNVSGQLNIPFPPEKADLVRLHKTIRERKSFTVLEFGLGYSTLVMADALAKNERDYQAIEDKPELRNNHLFEIHSVDASAEWIESLSEKIPDHLKSRISITCSDVEIGTFQGQICHYYKKVPNVIPDFIYLDGPAPKDVKGDINGMNFQIDERTVMSGDLLLMEPTFLPGTFIHVDGRTNNCRFLQNNFRRNYLINWNKEGDCTTFELDEERLGKYNIIGKDFM